MDSGMKIGEPIAAAKFLRDENVSYILVGYQRQVFVSYRNFRSKILWWKMRRDTFLSGEKPGNQETLRHGSKVVTERISSSS